MAKKKSKTQKYKRNLKKKQNKINGVVTTNKSNIMKVNAEEKNNLKKELENKMLEETEEEPRRKVVEKDKINYNVLITYENKEKISKENKKNDDLENTKQLLKKEIKEEIKEEVKDAVKKIDKPQKIVDSESLDDISSPFMDIKREKPKKTYFELVVSRIKKYYVEYKIKRKKLLEEKRKQALRQQNNLIFPKLKKNNSSKKPVKSVKAVDKQEYDPYEIKTKVKTTNSKNPLVRLLVDIYNNTHILFNSIGIVIFIIMIIGLFRINIFETGTVIYIAVIVGFLLFVAISFNRYISGKIFTIIISIGMMFAIFYMQYTYDFIRNLNTGLYEYKTYYVVTFDNGVNKSIHNINNKKVGLLKDNCVNIERKLNTKIEPVYIEYEDINKLFDDFYSQEFRAILVNDNQYKYLKNNIQNSRPIKVLYEFDANSKKQ